MNHLLCIQLRDYNVLGLLVKGVKEKNGHTSKYNRQGNKCSFGHGDILPNYYRSSKSTCCCHKAINPNNNAFQTQSHSTHFIG
jgi:hypothetical protein